MFLNFCWNLFFLLEPVGTTLQAISISVGTKNRFQQLFQSSNKITTIQYQYFNSFFGLLLERWNVGTKYDLKLYEIFFL